MDACSSFLERLGIGGGKNEMMLNDGLLRIELEWRDFNLGL